MYTVQPSMFEGLYLRGLGVAPGTPLARKLAEGGYDVEAPRAVYDISVWTACLDVTGRELHPGLPRFEAWRRLGRTFIEGYFQTLIGSGIALVLPWMKPDRFLDRTPAFLRTGLGGLVADVDQPRPGEAVVSLAGPHQGSAFVLSGVFEGCFERMQVPAGFFPEVTGPADSRVVVRWTP